MSAECFSFLPLPSAFVSATDTQVERHRSLLLREALEGVREFVLRVLRKNGLGA